MNYGITLYYKLSRSKEKSGSIYVNIELSTRHIIELKQATKNDQNIQTSSKIVVTLGKG